jgi:hypothetical protein
MKIAVLGATGWIGGTVAAEVQQRGHELIALVRDPARFTLAAEVRRANSLDPASLEQALDGVELLIASIGGRADGQHGMVADSARTLLKVLPRTGVTRLLWVGGAGSLEVAPGATLLSQPDFPEEYRRRSPGPGPGAGPISQRRHPGELDLRQPRRRDLSRRAPRPLPAGRRSTADRRRGPLPHQRRGLRQGAGGRGGSRPVPSPAHRRSLLNGEPSLIHYGVMPAKARSPGA